MSSVYYHHRGPKSAALYAQSSLVGAPAQEDLRSGPSGLRLWLRQQLVSGYICTNFVGNNPSWCECRNWCKCSLTPVSSDILLCVFGDRYGQTTDDPGGGRTPDRESQAAARDPAQG